MTRGRSWAEIDLDVLAGNIRGVVGNLKRSSRLMAVVKAGGYGHGAVAVARVAVREGASFLGVATLEEALELHHHDPGVPVMVLGWTAPGDYPEAVRAGIRLSLSTGSEGRELAAEARRQARPAVVHVKIDTGMGRLGMPPTARSAELISSLAGEDGLVLEGIFTHFACADGVDKRVTEQQLGDFTALATMVEQQTGPLIKHAANTAGYLDLPHSHLDMVRVGLGLYGLYPSSHVDQSLDLKPAMTWKTRVALVKEVPAGTPLSYGHTYRTESPGQILTLAVGYADGYRRSLSNRAMVIVNGTRFPVVGRVCMDQSMALAPPSARIKVGAEVILMGAQAGERVTAEELATWSSTINYEVVTGVGGRVTRLYTGSPDSQEERS